MTNEEAAIKIAEELAVKEANRDDPEQTRKLLLATVAEYRTKGANYEPSRFIR